MGIREKLNENPMIAGGVTAGITLIAVVWCIWYAYTSCNPGGTPAFTQAWYTTEQDKATFTTSDEGKLFFADKATKLAPFDKNGKEAVRVYLYTCDGKTLKVGFLERYTPEAKAALEKAAGRKGPPQPGDPDVMDLQMNGREIKKPGGKWVTRLQGEQAWQDAEQIEPCAQGQELKPHFPPK